MQKISDAKEKHTFKALKNSFKYALNGVFTALAICRNLKIHYVLACIAIASGFYFDITQVELAIILLAITLVVTLEMMNTAIEKVVDLLTEKYHILALIAKDIAAGAVLIASVIAFIIGALIFGPHLVALLT
ncbi:MAG: diacylglycerol kinase family protein [Defluviitaleaceae bacterium]|nr:diacylglycerol kinase family protein [Defluviitaleaceae bacterium]